MKFIKICKL